MANRMTGKVALVSGAARGMGAAEAQLLAREGARVVVADVLDAEGQGVCDAINAEIGDRRASYVHLDVSQASDWERAISTAEREFGTLNVLVNNAAIHNGAGLEETSEELWDRVVAVNQKGVWLGMKTALPAMRRAGGGAIVNFSSVHGLVGSPGSTAYQGTKGAVRLLSKQAAIQYASENVRVNSVHPGLIFTPMIEAVPREGIDAMIQVIPMQRGGTPAEVAWLVLFLASDESSYITGAEFVIDGGFTAM